MRVSAATHGEMRNAPTRAVASAEGPASVQPGEGSLSAKSAEKAPVAASPSALRARIEVVPEQGPSATERSPPATVDGGSRERATKKAKKTEPGKDDAADRDAGVIRRSAAWRAKYNPSREKTLMVPTMLGFHGFNREGIPCNGDRCDTLLRDMVYDGFEPEEADRDNLAIRVSGPNDPGIAYNVDVCADHPKLAVCPKGWFPVALTLSHSHVNQILKNCVLGAKSDVASIVDSTGKINMELVHQKDPLLAKQARKGLHWEVFPSKMAEEEPEACHDISAAANIKNGRAMLETEMQGFLRLGRVCVAEASLSHEVDFQLVKQKMAITMPKLVKSPHFVNVFSLALMLGANKKGDDASVSRAQTKGVFLSRLGDFFGQWVNPAVRQVRYSDFAVLGQFPAAVEGFGTAPLLCAVIEAMYAADLDRYIKDDYLEWLKPNDVKIDTKSEEDKARVKQASQGANC